MKEAEPRSPSAWWSTWPDVLGFGAGLGLAWQFQWKTADLVWSLWLSSLLVGYATIVWSLITPPVLLGGEGRRGAAVVAAVGGVFLLAFFTVHFGMFHFVHAMFLNMFFPLAEGSTDNGLLPLGAYWTVLARYWWFVPLALLAERQAFQVAPLPPEPPAASVQAADIAARKARNARLAPGANVFAPYRNVVRLHLLIFFFAAANFAHLDGFLVYAVVYAAYFFPWRVFAGRPEASAGSGLRSK